jgi:hypothetical protein
MIDTEKLAGITALASGAHTPNGGAMCAMEAAAYIAGEPWSDHPQCVSPVIAAFMRSWNDALPDADRTRLLLPLIPDTIGTRTTDADEETRAWMATDWLVRVQTPAWLRLAGLTDHAHVLESCARLVDAVTARAEQPNIAAARAPAGAAAGAPARAAAGAAAWAAAWAAARDAAGDAAWAALTPTVATLQASACDLVRAMCAVGRPQEQEMGR